MSSQTICCGTLFISTYEMCKSIIIAEIAFCFFLSIPFLLQIHFHTDTMEWNNFLPFGTLVIYSAYLFIELIGIHKKIRGLIIFSCVIRVILSVLGGVVIIMFICLAVYAWIKDYILLAGIIIILILGVLIMLYLILRTRILFRVFYDNSDNSTLNNTIELQPSTIISSQTICCGILFISIYEMARIIIGTEIALCFVLSIPFLLQIHFHFDTMKWNSFLPFETLVIYSAYLFTELIGIHKKIRGLIIFSCVIRVILSVMGGTVLSS